MMETSPASASLENKNPIEKLDRPELSGLSEWYDNQLEKLGEMTEDLAPLTDGENWKSELNSNNEVEKVSGAHFTIEGRKIVKHNPDGSVAFQWSQPGIIQTGEELSLPTGEKTEQMKNVSGFVGAIMHENKILITLTQEPFAHTPKKALARTPFQASAKKFSEIINGKREVDPQLFDLLSSLSPEKKLTEIFEMGTLDVFPLPHADANRIDTVNLGFIVKLSDPALIEKLKNNDQNRWCKPNELAALAKTGILNGHTAALTLATL